MKYPRQSTPIFGFMTGFLYLVAAVITLMIVLPHPRHADTKLPPLPVSFSDAPDHGELSGGPQ